MTPATHELLTAGWIGPVVVDRIYGPIRLTRTQYVCSDGSSGVVKSRLRVGLRR